MRKIILITIITATCLTSAFVAFRALQPLPSEPKEVISPELFSEYLETEINKIRGNGLKHSETLCRIANERIEDLRDTGFSHTEFNNKSIKWLNEYNYAWIGENLVRDPNYIEAVGWNYDTEDAEITALAWLNSPSHYENIMKPEYNETCVVCSDAYCVQIFAESPPAKPE